MSENKLKGWTYSTSEESVETEAEKNRVVGSVEVRTEKDMGAGVEAKGPVNKTVTKSISEDEANLAKSKATTSMVLGIISVSISWMFFLGAVSVALGIIGLIMASKAKKLGFEGSTRTAGFILSIIGISIEGIVCITTIL